jgi:hypothetical protein
VKEQVEAREVLRDAREATERLRVDVGTHARRVASGGYYASLVEKTDPRPAPDGGMIVSMRRLSLAVASAIAVAASACATAPAVAPETAAVRYGAAAVNRPYEVDAAVHPGPLDATARAVVEAPSGARVTLPAFRRGNTLVARFRPREAGEFRWRLVAGRDEDPRVLEHGTVVVEDLGDGPGIHARGADLVDPSGRIFRPLGENRFDVYDPTWSDGLSVDAYVKRMAADGMNTLRVFVFTGCGKPGARPVPGCLEPRLGDFDEVAAVRYDEILAAAERHDVKVVLSIFAGGFTPGDGWKGWESNPYAKARGGPARAPRDFFEDPAARELARRRLRYVLARWGASPALLAVDLLNEPELDGGIPESAWIPWAEDLARTWHALDPYGHPVTLGSVGLHWKVERDEREWWKSPQCDLVQWHRTGKDVHDVHALATALVTTIRDTARYRKPVLIGEFGWGGDPAPLYDHTHVGIWSATFAGAGVLAHSAPPSIDSDAPMTPARARSFRALSAFLRRADPRGTLEPAPDPQVSRRGALGLALASELSAAVWVLGPAEGYGKPVSGLTVSVAGIAPGKWRATWVDDRTGKDLAAEELQVKKGARAGLTAPTFTRHVALLLERVGR